MKTAAAAFTLVEILVTLVFMGVVLPAVVSALLVANRASITADRAAVAGQLAQNELSELLVGDLWASSPNRGDFGKEHPGYSWIYSQRQWPQGPMTELTVEVKFQVQGHDQSVKLVTLATQNTGNASPSPASSLP